MIKVSHIEIVQALQENLAARGKKPGKSEKPVPLLAGKRSLARVYLRNTVATEVCRVRGKLRITFAANGSETVVDIDSGSQFVALADPGVDERQQRLDLDNSLNFEFRLWDLLDREAEKPVDPIELSLKVVDLQANGTAVRDGGKPAIFRFEPGKSLKLQMLGLRYADQDGILYYPDRENFTDIRHSIENLYPVNACTGSQVVVDADPEFTLPFSAADEAEPDWEWYYKVSLAHAQLLAHRTLDLDANLIWPKNDKGDIAPGPGEINPRLRKTWYYGVADFPDDDFFRGAASGIQDAGEIEIGLGAAGTAPANFDYVACGPVEDAGGLYAAHEIAHCLDLHHPGIGDQYRVAKDYPFVEGFISVDRYPDDDDTEYRHFFEDPKTITDENADAFVQMSRVHHALINNATLQRIVDRHHLRKYQGQGNPQSVLEALREDLENWREARRDYGCEHQGLSWRNWRFDRELLSHAEHYDFMGYLEPKWISPYSYLRLHRHIAGFREDKAFDGNHDAPPNYCIIGLYNENLGSASIKYLFRTHQQPTRNPSLHGRSVQLRFDDKLVDGDFIHHKDRRDNKLGDPVFLRAGIFKCIIGDRGYLEDDAARVSRARNLSLFIAQSMLDTNGDSIAGSKNAWQSGMQKQQQEKQGTREELVYQLVDQVSLGAGKDEEKNASGSRIARLCDCRKQPFQVYRSTVESDEAEYFLKLTGEIVADCSYILQARFFDRELFESQQRIGLTNWMTLGVNFRAAQYQYIDKNHCLVPGSALDSLYAFLFAGKNGAKKSRAVKLAKPFKEISEYYEDLAKREGRVPDLFALAIELVCMSALERTRVFKGMIIEKPRAPGEFYFIDSDDRRYRDIRQRFEDFPDARVREAG